MKKLIAPSLLSADFSKLGAEVEEIETAGADWIHVDVMDGHFVPNLTIGPVVVKGIRKFTSLPLDCHLMVQHPERWIEPFVKAGADLITVHTEATSEAIPIFQQIRDMGCKAGVSLNPETSVDEVEEFLDEIDLVLVMSVHPGWAGQSFIPEVLSKVERLAGIRGTRPYQIEIDGGIHEDTIEAAANAGADVFVAGSAVFGKTDRKEAIKKLRAKI